MDKALDRVKDLVALAVSSTFPEEARTAAMQAVLLIKKHDLLNGIKVRGSSTKPKPTPASERSAFDLKILAEYHVRDLVRTMSRKPVTRKGVSFTSARWISDRAVDLKLVTDTERQKFHYYVTCALRKEAKGGTLEYVPGCGYMHTKVKRPRAAA
jgi:hypothetical protein